MPGAETTALSPQEEQQFRTWIAANKIADLDQPDTHYDYRGFWKATKGAPHPPGSEQHFPDTFKQHGHPTFSVESQYSKGPNDGGRWNGDTYVPQATAAPKQTLAQIVRAKHPGVYDDLSDAALDASVRAKYPGVYDDIPKSGPNQVTAKPEDFTEKPPPQTLGRFIGSTVKSLLPSTTLSDYVEGPLYAARHPIDSAKLISSAMYGGSADQGAKAKEAAGRIMSAPTIGGKVAATSEAIGHAAGMVPVIGTPAAQAGEQIASGDVAGGLGSATGLIGSQFAGDVANAAAPAAARLLAGGNVERMTQALGATTNENKVRSARIAPVMVKRGIWNKDLPSLEARAAAESEKAGQKVGAEVASVASKEVDVAPLVAELEKAKEQFIDTPSPNSSGHGGVPKQIVHDAAPVAAIQQIQDTLNEYGDKVSIASVNKLRKNLDATVQAGRGFTTPDLGTHWKTWAAREGRSVLRDEIGKASPDMDKVMAEYAFWQNIEDVAHATNQRRVGQGAGGGLINSIASGAGTIAAEALVPGAGAATKIGAAAIGGKLAGSLKRLVSSPGWKMFTAVQRQRIADAFAAGNTAAIDEAFQAANAGNRIVGRTSQQDSHAGRVSTVGVNNGQQSSDDQQAAR